MNLGRQLVTTKLHNDLWWLTWDNNLWLWTLGRRLVTTNLGRQLAKTNLARWGLDSGSGATTWNVEFRTITCDYGLGTTIWGDVPETAICDYGLGMMYLGRQLVTMNFGGRCTSNHLWLRTWEDLLVTTNVRRQLVITDLGRVWDDGFGTTDLDRRTWGDRFRTISYD